jgi:hypothetical protein
VIEYVKDNKVLGELTQQEREALFDRYGWARGSKAVNLLIRLDVVVSSNQASIA